MGCNKNLHVNTASNGSAFHVNAGNSAVSQSMDGRGFPIYISVQVCTHPDRSKTVRRNPERLRKSSTAVIPYYVHIYSQVRGWCMMLHVCYASAGRSMCQSSPSQEKLYYTSDKVVHPHDDGVFVGSAQLGRVVPTCTGLFGWEKNKAFNRESCY